MFRVGAGVRSAGIALLVTCVASCAPQQMKRKRRVRSESSRPVVTVRGLDDPAARYGDETPPTVSRRPLERAVLNLVQSVAASSRQGAPTLDEGLSRAAKVIVRGAHRFDGLSSELQKFARAQSGTLEPIVQYAYSEAHHRYFERGEYGELRAQIVDALQSEHVTHFGVGVHEDLGGMVRILTVFSKREIRVEPFPTHLPSGGRQTITFELAEGYDEPTVYVELPNGFVEARQVESAGLRRFQNTFVCPEAPGMFHLEIFGSNHTGPNVLVNVPLACGQPHPRELSFELTGKASQVPTVAEAEAEMFARVNAERTKRSLRPVELDAVLTEVARGHSVDMADNGFFAHISPSTGSVGDRSKAAGVVAGAVGENIAMNRTVDAMHLGLMGSPGHRMLILHPEMDRVGVGVVIQEKDGGTRMWVTQVFAAPVPTAAPPVATPAPDRTAPPAKRASGAPTLAGTIRIVDERPGFADCALVGMQMEDAPETGPTVASRLRSKLAAEAKRRKANTMFVEDRSTNTATSLVADFFRCP